MYWLSLTLLHMASRLSGWRGCTLVVCAVWPFFAGADRLEAEVGDAVIAAEKVEVSEGVKAPVRFATSMIKPWGMDVEGEQQGLLIQLLPYLERETGLPIDNVLRPYARVFHDLYSGSVDMAIVFDSPETRVKAIRIGTVMSTQVVVVAKSHLPEVTSLAGLAGFSVGNLRGSLYGTDFDQARFFTRVRVNSTQQGLAMVLRDRIDAMAAVDHSLSWALRHMDAPPGSLKAILTLPGPVTSLYLSRQTERPELARIFSAALARLREQGVLARFYGHRHDWSAGGACIPDTSEGADSPDPCY